eukprot:TRINITY_DN14954_c2_g1_i2.p4 TRINITY_DN14954_c2_g1~~TRINITY_DN14954_c2_g1_i2.p4  ORF type:complete len:156 (+),score=10.19 TRINITY_DN14954_c2_g1_i2:411-878(+)
MAHTIKSSSFGVFQDCQNSSDEQSYTSEKMDEQAAMSQIHTFNNNRNNQQYNYHSINGIQNRQINLGYCNNPRCCYNDNNNYEGCQSEFSEIKRITQNLGQKRCDIIKNIFYRLAQMQSINNSSMPQNVSEILPWEVQIIEYLLNKQNFSKFQKF